jgi:hypothetical protein
VAGIESSDEVELNETLVATETAWESVTEHVKDPPEIAPFGLQTKPETGIGVIMPITVVCVLAPNVAVTVAL